MSSLPLLSKYNSTTFCGKIPIPSPFLISNSTVSSPLHNLVICRSQKLYFRTSLGLFLVSSIDYTAKTLTISHPSCSSSRNFVSPALLYAGFPILTTNSLLLFNCASKNYSMTSVISNCTRLKACAASSKTQEQEHEIHYSCLLVNNLVDKGFYPKDLNCSHYSLVYRSSLSNDEYEEYELGTRISFDFPDHVPDLCNECKKPNGNCEVGLKCIYHPKECNDKVISMAVLFKPIGINVLLSIFILVWVTSMDF